VSIGEFLLGRSRSRPAIGAKHAGGLGSFPRALVAIGEMTENRLVLKPEICCHLATGHYPRRGESNLHRCQRGTVGAVTCSFLWSRLNQESVSDTPGR
jgi:hypothetical protein